jgi:hypothetical protein
MKKEVASLLVLVFLGVLVSGIWNSEDHLEFHEGDEIKIVGENNISLQKWIDLGSFNAAASSLAGESNLWNENIKLFHLASEIRVAQQGGYVSLKDWIDGSKKAWSAPSIWHKASDIKVTFGGREISLQEYIDSLNDAEDSEDSEDSEYYRCVYQSKIGLCDNTCIGQVYNESDKNCVFVKDVFCNDVQRIDCDEPYFGNVYQCPMKNGANVLGGSCYSTCQGQLSSNENCFYRQGIGCSDYVEEKCELVKTGVGNTEEMKFTIPKATSSGSVNEILSLDSLIYEGGAETVGGGGEEFNVQTCNQGYTELKQGIKIEGVELGKEYQVLCNKEGESNGKFYNIVLDEDFKTIFVDEINYPRVHYRNLIVGTIVNFENRFDKYAYDIALQDGEIKVRISDYGSCTPTETIINIPGREIYGIECNGRVEKCSEGETFKFCSGAGSSLATTAVVQTCRNIQVSPRQSVEISSICVAEMCPVNVYRNRIIGWIGLELLGDPFYQAQWKELNCELKEIEETTN